MNDFSPFSTMRSMHCDITDLRYRDVRFANLVNATCLTMTLFFKLSQRYVLSEIKLVCSYTSSPP